MKGRGMTNTGKVKGKWDYIYIIFLYYIYTYMYINIVFKNIITKNIPSLVGAAKKREKWENRKNIHSFCKGFTINRQIFLHVT